MQKVQQLKRAMLIWLVIMVSIAWAEIYSISTRAGRSFGKRSRRREYKIGSILFARRSFKKWNSTIYKRENIVQRNY